MILFESMVPQDRRQMVAGLIRSATSSCAERRRFYALAAQVGMVAAAAATLPDTRFRALLMTELEDITTELIA